MVEISSMEIHEDEEIPCTQKDDDPCSRVLGRCNICGYVNHDIPRYSDEAHYELCVLEEGR